MTQQSSFHVDRRLQAFIDDQIAKGRYPNSTQVIEAALNLLEERERKIGRLRDALIEGEESGPATPFDFEDFIATKNAGG